MNPSTETTEPKFTKGPWSTNGRFVWLTSDQAEISQRGESISFEVNVPDASTGEIEDICHLVAAGPDLYEALNAVASVLEEAGFNYFTPQDAARIRGLARESLLKVDAALAKATKGAK